MVGLRDRAGMHRVVEKSPSNSPHAERIRTGTPNAPMRDGNRLIPPST